MNDTSHTDAQSTDAVSADVGDKSAWKRQLVLIAILAIMLGALYWDRKVARPNSEAKKEELDQLASARLATSDPQLSREEVAEALGRKPSNSREKDGYIIEKFSWRGGLPWRTYDVNVVYSKTKDGGGRYYASFYNEEPEDAQLATAPADAEGGDSPPLEPGDVQGGPPMGDSPTESTPDGFSPDPTGGSPGGPPSGGPRKGGSKGGSKGGPRKGDPSSSDRPPLDDGDSPTDPPPPSDSESSDSPAP